MHAPGVELLRDQHIRRLHTACNRLSEVYPLEAGPSHGLLDWFRALVYALGGPLPRRCIRLCEVAEGLRDSVSEVGAVLVPLLPDAPGSAHDAFYLSLIL